MGGWSRGSWGLDRGLRCGHATWVVLVVGSVSGSGSVGHSGRSRDGGTDSLAGGGERAAAGTATSDPGPAGWPVDDARCRRDGHFGARTGPGAVAGRSVTVPGPSVCGCRHCRTGGGPLRVRSLALRKPALDGPGALADASDPALGRVVHQNRHAAHHPPNSPLARHPLWPQTHCAVPVPPTGPSPCASST